MFSVVRRLIGGPLLGRSRRLAAAFLDQTKRADEVQARLLKHQISRHADSQFGRDHHFKEIRNAADFRRRVPIRGYDEIEPYIERVRQGEIGALFGPGTRVRMFAMTSGTTNKPKTIPVTDASLHDYREGWTIWGIMAFDAHPEMLANGLLPILQIASDWRESVTPSGIPCGAITGLTAQMQSRLVRLNYCLPAAAAQIKDIESKYYVALRCSVHRDLGATIAANPSTMLAIARLGDREKACLIRDIHDGTIDRKWRISQSIRSSLPLRIRLPMKKAARRLETIVQRSGRLYPKDYWPNLCFLANWTGGTMGAFLRSYPEYFGDRPVRDVGLIASEGRLTIPIDDHTPAGILDIRHHYFEFIPEDQVDRDEPDTLEAHELVEGGRYFILPTTAGGLYRYQIFDLVRCTGFHGKAPLIEFLNKGAHISSMAGEKLSEYQVVAAVSEAQRRLGLKLQSFLLLPTWGDPPSYSLLLEETEFSDAKAFDRFGITVDVELKRINSEYENKRSTLRLGPIRVCSIAVGSWSDFQRRRLARSGGTVEQYKQPHLMPDLNAIDTFTFRANSCENRAPVS
jgi:hypothetical protein